ncbi:MAG: hypothetical protein ACKVT0_04865, partial [Planctomycetaceae bacterium]
MSSAYTYWSRLLPVVGSNVAVVMLAFAGLAVVHNFTDGAMFILLLVVSLLQGGLMVRAFGPVAGSESGLSLGGQIVGWIGFIGWFVVHLVNAGIATPKSVPEASFIVLAEVLLYGVVHTILLIPFYTEPIREHRRRRQEAVSVATKARSHDQSRSDEEARRKTDQQRRDDARLECQLYYDRHADRFKLKFPRERLQEYFAAYMTDAHPTEAVDQRARLLLEMLREQLQGQPGGAVAFGSLADIATHFSTQRVELETLPYDEETRD